MRFSILFFFLLGFHAIVFCNTTDSLLNVLDKSLAKRQIYIQQKENKLLQLTNLLDSSQTKEEEYRRSKQIMEEYSYFISDSALYYSKRCLDLAMELNNDEYVLDMKLERAYLLSFPQLFHESLNLLESIDPEEIPDAYKRKYFYTYIHVYHNQIKDINDVFYRTKYRNEQALYLDAYLSIGNKESLEYLTMLAYKYYMNGMVEESVRTVNLVLQHPDITPYIHAEFLFKLGGVLIEAGKENWEEAKNYLAQASIEYNRLAIKKNPPLMYLAIILQEEKKTDQAYHYINIAMEEGRMFSNSHRHSIAERIHTLIQNTYYDKISDQQNSLRYYSGLITTFFVLLLALFVFIYKRNQILNKTKLELSEAVSSLKEHSNIKEIYIGRYITMYSAYITKFEDYRRAIIRKLKSGNTEDLLKSENALLNNTHHEIDFLFSDFDNTFLELYPEFIERVNNLLQEENCYIIKEEKKMNTELRILALLKLGISDNKVIASFLRVTVQTVYNYRSKIKAKAVSEVDFEEAVKKI